MVDRILIQGLQVDCIIGLAEWERMVRQSVVLDLKLACDVRSAARADRVVAGAMDTKALSKRLQSYISETSFQLLETLAERVAEIVVKEFPVERVWLRLSKPGALRGARNVAVEIARRPADYGDL